MNDTGNDPTNPTEDPTLASDTHQCCPGQHFHMDYGFIHGSGFAVKDKEQQTLTSLDGFNSYLLIIDHPTELRECF